LKFEKTPEAKHIGIVHVRLFNKVILRYKVIENKDGSGYFVAPPSYKRDDGDNQKWVTWFMLDSQVFSEEVEDVIRENLSKLKGGSNSSPSALTTDMAGQSIAQGSNAPKSAEIDDEVLPF